MKKQKTLLIIGAGHEQVPAIQKAKSFGHKVVVTDLNPQAPGIQYADHFEQVSTHEKHANLEVAKKQKIDGVMTLGSELAVPVVAHIAQALKLPGITPETALKATNKNAMKACFVANEVPTPLSKKIGNLEELRNFAAMLNWPIVIKPSDSSGQRGVGVYENLTELEAAFSEAVYYASDDYAIVENYVTGPEINVTALVQNGEVHFLSLSHRVTAKPPHFGIAIEHRSPADIPSSMVAAIKQACIKAIRAIGLENGIAYPQVIASPNGPQVVEIATRIPGGYMREVALILSGIDMIEVAIMQALSEPLSIDQYASHPKYGAVIVKFFTELDLPKSTKTLTRVAGFESILTRPGVFYAKCHLSEGDPVPELSSSTARFAAIICYGDSLNDVQQHLKSALASVEVA